MNNSKNLSRRSLSKCESEDLSKKYIIVDTVAAVDHILSNKKKYKAHFEKINDDHKGKIKAEKQVKGTSSPKRKLTRTVVNKPQKGVVRSKKSMASEFDVKSMKRQKLKDRSQSKGPASEYNPMVPYNILYEYEDENNTLFKASATTSEYGGLKTDHIIKRIMDEEEIEKQRKIKESNRRLEIEMEWEKKYQMFLKSWDRRSSKNITIFSQTI